MEAWQGYFDVSVHEGPESTVSYRTANFVYEEGLRDGKWVALAYNAAGCLMSANPLPAPYYMDVKAIPCPQSFGAVVDGQELNGGLTYRGLKVERRENGLTARVALEKEGFPCAVEVVTELDGTGILLRFVEILNASDHPATLSEMAPLSGGVQALGKPFGRAAVPLDPPEPPYRLGYFRDAAWGAEGMFTWQDLPQAEFSVGGRYRWDRFRHPLFVLNNRQTGETFIGQMGWSGGYKFSFDYQNPGNGDAFLCQRIALDGPAPLSVLEPGERWVSPQVHIGAVFGGLDEAVNAMHAHLRRIFLPKRADMRELVSTGIGPEYDMSQANTLEAMETAASLGSELFWIDAGWYTPPGKETEWFERCGDWTFDKERYPQGIAPLRERCHQLGMRFGVWMEVERLGVRARARKARAQWVQTRESGEENAAGWLDLGLPECAAWVEEEIAGLIRCAKLDHFRLDWNVGRGESVNVRKKGRWRENTWDRHYKALYALFARLRRRFPDVVFENCASGGARTDVAMSAQFYYTWVTDWQIHPDAFRITNGMTMALPPEHIDRLTGGQLGYVTADLRTQLRNQLFTHMSVGGITPGDSEVNPRQMAIIRENVALYKRFVRPFLPESRIYHHTPALGPDQPVGILELDARDGSRGILGVFLLSCGDAWESTVRLRGIREEGRYRVRLDNGGGVWEVAGWELMHRGVTLRLEGNLTSELMIYERLNEEGKP